MMPPYLEYDDTRYTKDTLSLDKLIDSIKRLAEEVPEGIEVASLEFGVSSLGDSVDQKFVVWVSERSESE